MKTFAALLMSIIIIICSFFLVVLASSLAIASANSWILGGNFSDAWSLCIEKKFIVFGWAVLFFTGIAAATRKGTKY